MQHRREHQDRVRSLQQIRVSGLRFNQIHDRVRQRAIITNRTGKDERHVIFHALVHHTAGNNSRFDGVGDAAIATNQVDRIQVVTVTAAHCHAAFHIHTQRRT